MADFRLISSQPRLAYLADADAFVLDPGAAGQLALWGGGPNGEALDVRTDDPGVVQVVRVDAPSRGQDLRAVHLKAVGFGLTKLSGRLPDGRSWAEADVAVGFTPGTMIETHNTPMYGEIPFVLGAASMIPIPVPGTKGLCIQLSPRGWVPKNGTTSTLFIQDALGKRNLRLDYGFNVKTGTVNYHWNQKGTSRSSGSRTTRSSAASEALSTSLRDTFDTRGGWWRSSASPRTSIRSSRPIAPCARRPR